VPIRAAGVRPVHLNKVASLRSGTKYPVTGAVTGRSGCAWMHCSWLSGAVAERARGAVSVTYVLQDLLTTTDVRTRHRSVASIREPKVRAWRHGLLESGVNAVTMAKAYRLLKAIFNTAVDDGLIRRNPCRTVGGGQERSAERPVLTVEQVGRLAEAIGVRYQALVLLATFASLRWGELAALTRRNVDLDACTVRAVSSLTETDSGTLLPGLPKSAAGRRTAQLPPLIVPSLSNHLNRYAQPDDDGLVFVSPRGTRLRRSNFRRRVWLPALTKAGLPGIHFHDLRHTGNIPTATAGASLRELMARMGHASTRAALVYLHDTDDRQRTIATVVSDLARPGLGHTNAPSEEGTENATGTCGARPPHK
jgi:integrase